MTETGVGRVQPIEHRLSERMRLPFIARWFVVTAVVLAICTVWHNATGAWSGLEVGGEAIWWTPWRLEIVFAVILGYVFSCGSWIVGSVRSDLGALAPVLTIDPSDLAAERATIGRFPPTLLLVAGVAGVGVGIVVHAFVNAVLPVGHPALDDRAWRFVRDVTVWTLSIRLVAVAIASSLRVSRLAERSARIDLLDLRGLAPLTRIGLRVAFAFALAASMIAAMSSDDLTLPVTLATVAVVGVVGALTLLLPVHGAHRAIRAAKDVELRAVRASIARMRAVAIVRDQAATDDATRLGGLLAYEARIVGVGEWPFDVGTFVRFSLFLVLPLGSWVAGAIVERLVSRALG